MSNLLGINRIRLLYFRNLRDLLGTCPTHDKYTTIGAIINRDRREKLKTSRGVKMTLTVRRRHFSF